MMASLGALVLVGAWIGTAVVRNVARRASWLDVPNERSSHEQPIPRGGGLAIALVSLVGLSWVVHSEGAGPGWYLALGLLLGMAALGFADDWRDLAPGPRLVAQVVAGAAFLLATGGWDALDLPGVSLQWGLGGIAVGTLVIVAHTNFFNFMDGIDGLAAVQAITVGAGMALVAAGAGDHFLVLVWIVVAAAACGFLPWNVPPARIFMGDVGSSYLGFAYAAVAVAGDQRASTSIATFFLLTAVFWVDASATLLLRLVQREPLTQAHRTHAYQLATRMLGAHLPVTATVAVLNTCLVGAAVLTQGSPAATVAAFGIAVVFLLVVWTGVQSRWRSHPPGVEPSV